MLRLAAGLPDALVGVPPDTGSALRLRLYDRPEPAWQALVPPSMEQDRVRGPRRKRRSDADERRHCPRERGVHLRNQRGRPASIRAALSH